MAWLDATEEDEKTSRREKFQEGGEGSPFLVMPPLDPDLLYLLTLWQEAGMISVSANGVERLSWPEIDSWIKRTKTYQKIEYKTIRPRGQASYKIPIVHEACYLDAWEIEIIRGLSEQYANSYHASKEKGCKPPYGEVVMDDVARVAVANKVKSIFGALKVNKAEPRYTIEARKE